MKQEKMIIMAAVAVNLTLAAVCIVLYIRMDRTAPEFTFQEASVVYREGMDMEELLVGVTAKDSRDGDVTGRIVVEKVTESMEDNSIVVFYAVSDGSGNVARASRVFPISDDVSVGRTGVVVGAGAD